MHKHTFATIAVAMATAATLTPPDHICLHARPQADFATAFDGERWTPHTYTKRDTNAFQRER